MSRRNEPLIPEPLSLSLNNIDAMGTLQDGFITDIGNLPKELQDRINNGLQTQIIKEAELVKNDMPDYYLSYLDGEIGKAGASIVNDNAKVYQIII